MELIPQSSLFREHPCHISVLGCKRRAKRGDYDFVSKNKALALNRIVLRMAYINLFSSALPLHTRCWQRDNIEALNVVLSSLRAPRQIVILLILPGPKCVFPEKKKNPLFPKQIHSPSSPAVIFKFREELEWHHPWRRQSREHILRRFLFQTESLSPRQHFANTWRVLKMKAKALHLSEFNGKAARHTEHRGNLLLAASLAK